MKESIKNINNKAIKRARRVRSKISSSPERPRMSLHITNQHLYAQCFDDSKGTSLIAMSDAVLGKKVRNITVDLAKEIGKKFAETAKGKGIEKVVFDRGSKLYHGKVKAFADGAREGGLEF